MLTTCQQWGYFYAPAVKSPLKNVLSNLRMVNKKRGTIMVRGRLEDRWWWRGRSW